MNRQMQVQARDQFRIQIVRSSGELASTEVSWAELWREVDGLVFQSPAWIRAWWNTLPARHRHTLRIGLVWQGDKLRAVLPLVVTGRMGLRFLEWAALACTDYPDILAAPDCPLEALQALWRSILTAGGFDIVQLSLLSPQSRMTAVIAAKATGVNLLPGHRSEVSCRIVGDFSAEGGWLAQQSKKARQNYRRGYKVLGEEAEVRFRLLDPASEQLGPLVEQFCRLKRKWLKDTDRRSEALEAETGAVSALVGTLNDLDVLRVFVLERAGETVAIAINFEQRRTMMAFLTTFDPTYERASPGAVLIADYTQWSFDHGLRMVDFLRGAEDFKLRFATETVALETKVGARTIVGHAALLANRLRLRLRRTATRAEAVEPSETTKNNSAVVASAR